MLSYRHGFHAGNFADVFKHVLLVQLVGALRRKDKPFCLFDTHAGAGRYDLESAVARKNREHAAGIGRLWHRSGLGPELAEYLEQKLRPGETVAAVEPTVAVKLEAAEALARDHGIDAEVIDVRSLVPLDTQTILGSVAKTGRLFTVEENPRLLGWGAEIASIAADEAFWDLDGPIVRITTPHIPLPAADHLEDLALPNAPRIADKIVRVMNG